VVGGNLLFLRIPSAGSLAGLSLLERLNSGSVDGLLKLMFTPSHACGIPSVLLGIFFFWRFCTRPTWPLAALLGLWMGALTLIAEWYFFPFIGAAGILMLLQALAEIRRSRLAAIPKQVIWLRIAAPMIAIGWGFFNNTYVAGVFEHFWMHSLGQTSIVSARMEVSRFDQELRTAGALQAYARLTHKPVAPTTEGFAVGEDWPLPPLAWTPPGLVPLKINIRHFGMVPSWENAGSSGGSFVPLLSFRFIAECAPVMLLGMPFGLWLAWRRPNPIVRLLAVLALLSALPPVFLDWGFRSTDFLRFFYRRVLVLGVASGMPCFLPVGGRFPSGSRGGLADLRLRARQSLRHRNTRSQSIDLQRGTKRESERGFP
jgi:hypothetical protein